VRVARATTERRRSVTGAVVSHALRPHLSRRARSRPGAPGSPIHDEHLAQRTTGQRPDVADALERRDDAPVERAKWIRTGRVREG
jgi:hypothetical protein